MAAIFAIVAAIAAHAKGRNSLGWFFAGLAIGPFALLVAALPNVLRPGQYNDCAVCGESIRADAGLCRFCGYELSRTQVR
jgi:hypothetical protein